MPFNLKFDVAAMHFHPTNLVFTAKKKHNQKHKRTTHKRTTQPKIQNGQKNTLWMKTYYAV